MVWALGGHPAALGGPSVLRSPTDLMSGTAFGVSRSSFEVGGFG